MYDDVSSNKRHPTGNDEGYPTKHTNGSPPPCMVESSTISGTCAATNITITNSMNSRHTIINNEYEKMDGRMAGIEDGME